MKSWKSRSANSALAALSIAALLLVLPAHAAPLRAVATDMAFSGNGAIAAHLRRAIPRHLAAELAANPVDVPPGTRLVVRVNTVFLSSDLGGGEDGGMMMDALDGEALLVDARGQVLSRRSVTARMPPGTNVMDMGSEPRRVEALAESLAYWTVRGLR